MPLHETLPPFQSDGTLPPFVGDYPDRDRCMISPYRITMDEVKAQLGWDEQRVQLIAGLEKYRALLTSVQISGRQWIGGSFLTKHKATDIDLVNLFVRPRGKSSIASFNELVAAHPEAFDRPTIKSRFGCEVYFVDCGLPAREVAEHISYYTTLLSHDRDHRWRGFIEIDLL